MANERNSDLPTSLPTSLAAGPAEDAGGFDTFFREQYDPLVHFLRRRSRTEQDAEDAAQESLTRFIRYSQSQPPVAWKPTLYRIAINVVNDRLRKTRTHCVNQHVALEGLDIESDQPSMEENAALAQQRALLHEAILALPPKCRQVYVLKLLRGMTSADIAKRCGISVRMVEKHLANALLHIRRRLGQAESDTYQEERA